MRGSGTAAACCGPLHNHGMGDLGKYRRRRDPQRTPEPVPAATTEPLPRGDDDTFVIQEHHARRLHWDVRLERDGVLVSWAVPKGLPTEPGPARLAVHTEDHPLEYATFAGEIPAGEYGGGTITIWDRGRYEARKWSGRTVDVVLHGQRARGRYVFFRTGGERDWMVRRMDPPADPDWQPLPEVPEPMLATAGTLPPLSEDAAWGYEFCWEFGWEFGREFGRDGQRALARAEGGRVQLLAGGDDVLAEHRELRGLGAALGSMQVLLDGQLVALGAESGVSYLISDLLHLDGRCCTTLPYIRRRELLHGLDLQGPAWQTTPWYPGGGADVLRAARSQGLPGVLAKRLDSGYRPGRRSRDWREITGVDVTQVVIGGWRPRGGDGLPASLLVGASGEGGVSYLGAVSAGLTEPQRQALAPRLRRTARRTSPFSSGAPADGCWVTPALVGEVVFDGWTQRGTLRRPRWRGLLRP